MSNKQRINYRSIMYVIEDTNLLYIPSIQWNMISYCATKPSRFFTYIISSVFRSNTCYTIPNINDSTNIFVHQKSLLTFLTPLRTMFTCFFLFSSFYLYIQISLYEFIIYVCMYMTTLHAYKIDNAFIEE